MSDLKPLIALTVIHQSIESGVAGNESRGVPATPPKSRVVQPFKVSGRSFMAADVDQQDEMFKLGCVEFAPKDVALNDDDAATAKKSSDKKTEAKEPAKKTEAKEPAKKTEAKEPAKNAGSGAGTGAGADAGVGAGDGTDDGAGMV